MNWTLVEKVMVDRIKAKKAVKVAGPDSQEAIEIYRQELQSSGLAGKEINRLVAEFSSLMAD